MKKWNQIKNEPITWGSYAKLTGWCALITLIIGAITYAVMWGYYYADEISEWIKDTIGKIKSKFKKKDVC